jgi:predicted enzyme related to lactoylglutathione lyase
MDIPYDPSDQFYSALLGACESVQCTRYSAAGRRTERCRFSELPDGWSGYVVVDDVDQAAHRAQQLGAKTVVEPTDIAGIGRIYVCQDPCGTTVSLVSYFR